MNNGFFTLLCFLLAAGIVGTLGDPGTQKSTERRLRKNKDGIPARSKRKSQTPPTVKGKNLHVSTALSKNDNFVNLENVLFDREKLKNYVLDYLRTHAFAKGTVIADRSSLGHKTKSDSRNQEYRDKFELQVSNNNREYKYSGHRGDFENQGGDSGDPLSVDDSFSKTKPLQNQGQKKQVRGHRDHRDRQETKIDKVKLEYRRNGGHAKHSSDSRHQERSPNKGNFVSKEKSQQQQRYISDHFAGHFSANKYSLPFYFSVREVDGRGAAVRSHHSSSNHQSSETQGKQRGFKKGRKRSDEEGQISSKINTIVENRHKTTYQEGKPENRNTGKVSSLDTLPRSLHHGESNYKIHSRDKKRFTAHHRNRVNQSSGHDHRPAGRGHLDRNYSVSKPGVASDKFDHRDSYKRMETGLNERNSMKRDFVAVLPPQSFKLEGFDVEPVPTKQHDKKKRKLPKGQKHLPAKKTGSPKKSNEQEHGGKRKSSVVSESRENEQDSKADVVQKKSRRRETERKGSDKEIKYKNGHRKSSDHEGTMHKHSHKYKHGERKDIVTSVDGLRKIARQLEAERKSSDNEKTYKNGHTKKGEGTLHKHPRKEKQVEGKNIVTSKSHSHDLKKDGVREKSRQPEAKRNHTDKEKISRDGHRKKGEVASYKQSRKDKQGESKNIENSKSHSHDLKKDGVREKSRQPEAKRNRTDKEKISTLDGHSKKGEVASYKQSRKDKQVERTNIVTSKSHGHDLKKDGVREKSRQPEAKRNRTDKEKISRLDGHSKKGEVTSHKQSHKDKHAETTKTILTSKSHRSNHDAKKHRVTKTSQRQEEGSSKSSITRKSSKTSQTKKSDTALQKSLSQRKAKGKSSVTPTSSKHHTQNEDNNHIGSKKSAAHRKERLTTHKRKKASRHQDSKEVKFSPSWDSLDKRKIPSWYDDAKFGIFVHWGVYSVPSFGSEWFWYKWKGKQLQMYLNYTRENFPPGFSYSEFAPLFKAEFFDAKQWAELVARSGARYGD